jgi:hypothetical protein
MADQPPFGLPGYGPYAVTPTPPLDHPESMDFDWPCYQYQAFLNQLAPPMNYDAQALGPSFDGSFWPPTMRLLQSHSYEPSDIDSYESMECEEGYQGSDIFPCSATEDSVSQADALSDYDLARSWSSTSCKELFTPTETLRDIPRSQAPEDTQSTVGHTEIDSLMLAIQSSSAPTSNPSQLDSFPTRAKKHTCSYSQCNKSFSQRTHLLIHIRSHSGEKPYLCSVPCCGQRFSQLGNLKTHERRHRGEKPFGCDVPGCDKRFSQRSNLRSHCVSVHGMYVSSSSSSNSNPPLENLEDQEQTARFQCRLDGCATNSDFSSGTGKPFTQLGNLKAHQNKFHADTLKGLERKFATLISNTGGAEAALSIMDDEERELWRYFEGLYRNCNKGIKGRGKGRKVAA